ncbi:hypothetical protein G3V93_23315, partial [Escherichia coli]|nr:hypothetical protein [Escherichia coli]
MGIGNNRISFSVENTLKHSYSSERDCFSIELEYDPFDLDWQEIMDIEEEIRGPLTGKLMQEQEKKPERIEEVCAAVSEEMH